MVILFFIFSNLYHIFSLVLLVVVFSSDDRKEIPSDHNLTYIMLHRNNEMNVHCKFYFYVCTYHGFSSFSLLDNSHILSMLPSHIIVGCLILNLFLRLGCSLPKLKIFFPLHIRSAETPG